MDQITITLPLTERGLWVILSAIGLAAATGLVWLTLSEQDRKTPRTPLSWLIAFGWVLLPLWLAIFCATLWQVWAMLTGSGSILTGPGSLGAGALIAALLGAPFVIWGTVLRQRTVDFQKEGHITDRINKAVEQLGAEKTVKRHLIKNAGKKVFEKDKEGQNDFSKPVYIEETLPNIEVRIGGLLSLERIAQDSTRYDNGHDHVRVMEILCAYVRENATVSNAKEFQFPMWQPLFGNEEEKDKLEYIKNYNNRLCGDVPYRDSCARQWANQLQRARSDIEIALTIIGRRTKKQREIEATHNTREVIQEKSPFVEYFNLEQATLDGPVYNQRILRIKKLREEKIENGYRGYRLNLRDVNFQSTYLEEFDFSGADLRGSRFDGAVLRRSRFIDCYLGNTTFIGADLRKANFACADFRRSRFEASRLDYACFWGAMVGKEDTETHSESDLPTSFFGCKLGKVDFRSSSMAEAIFVLREQRENAPKNDPLDEIHVHDANLEGIHISRLENGKMIEGEQHFVQANVLVRCCTPRRRT